MISGEDERVGMSAPAIQPKQCRYCLRFFMSIGQREHHEQNAARLCKGVKA